MGRALEHDALMMPRALSFALYQQDNAKGQKSTGEWAVRDVVRRFLGSVNRPDVQDLVARLEPERAPDDDYDSNYN